MVVDVVIVVVDVVDVDVVIDVDVVVDMSDVMDVMTRRGCSGCDDCIGTPVVSGVSVTIVVVNVTGGSVVGIETGVGVMTIVRPFPHS